MLEEILLLYHLWLLLFLLSSSSTFPPWKQGHPEEKGGNIVSVTFSLDFLCFFWRKVYLYYYYFFLIYLLLLLLLFFIYLFIIIIIIILFVHRKQCRSKKIVSRLQRISQRLHPSLCHLSSWLIEYFFLKLLLFNKATGLSRLRLLLLLLLLQLDRRRWLQRIVSSQCRWVHNMQYCQYYYHFKYYNI